MKKKELKITTIIGKNSVVDGNYQATGSVRLDGTIEGDVKISGNMIIGASGKIHGNLEAGSTVVGGEVIGNIIAPNKTELTATARVIGDIKTDLIVIDEKAIFQGKCDMNQVESKPKRRPARENKAGKKSAKEALREALKEVEEEANASEEKRGAAIAANAMQSDSAEV